VPSLAVGDHVDAELLTARSCDLEIAADSADWQAFREQSSSRPFADSKRRVFAPFG